MMPRLFIHSVVRGLPALTQLSYVGRLAYLWRANQARIVRKSDVFAGVPFASFRARFQPVSVAPRKPIFFSSNASRAAFWTAAGTDTPPRFGVFLPEFFPDLSVDFRAWVFRLVSIQASLRSAKRKSHDVIWPAEMEQRDACTGNHRPISIRDSSSLVPFLSIVWAWPGETMERFML
jgi:hypothetical protein